MWLEVGKTEDCMMDAMFQAPRMWLEVGATEDSTVCIIIPWLECYGLLRPH